MQKLNQALTKHLTEAEAGDLKGLILDNPFLLAVLKRFILDELVALHKKQIRTPIENRDATYELLQSLGQQRAYHRMAELFTTFGVDDHPLIKHAPHTTMLGGVSKGE